MRSCRNCLTFNRPDEGTCRRCGVALADAELAPLLARAEFENRIERVNAGYNARLAATGTNQHHAPRVDSTGSTETPYKGPLHPVFGFTPLPEDHVVHS